MTELEEMKKHLRDDHREFEIIRQLVEPRDIKETLLVKSRWSNGTTWYFFHSNGLFDYFDYFDEG